MRREKRLSAAQINLVRLVAAGEPNKAIAHQLGMTEQSVKNKLHRLCRKLGMANRTDLAVYAWREGLVESEQRKPLGKVSGL